LTLLDEQLAAAVANSPDNAAHSGSVSGSTLPEGAAATTNRVAAPYTEADTAFRPDTPTEQTILPPNVNNQQQALLAAASPELRMAMQSAFLAAARAQMDVEEASRQHGRRQKTESAPNGAALLRVAAVVVAGLAVAIFIAAGFVR
jgi:hypothetical protein